MRGFSFWSPPVSPVTPTITSKMSYFVYVLQSQKDNKYYIGSSADVIKRLKFHNAGLQRSTRTRIPFILIYQEEFKTKQEALRREKYMKSLKGGEGFKRLVTRWKSASPASAGRAIFSPGRIKQDSAVNHVFLSGAYGKIKPEVSAANDRHCLFSHPMEVRESRISGTSNLLTRFNYVNERRE